MRTMKKPLGVFTIICVGYYVARSLVSSKDSASMYMSKEEALYVEKLSNITSELSKLTIGYKERGIWPSEDPRTNHPDSYRQKFLVNVTNTPMVKCISPETNWIKGWFSHENGSHVFSYDAWIKRGNDTICRNGTMKTFLYNSCNQQADRDFMLCDEDGKINATLLTIGGDNRQGCATSGYLNDILVDGDDPDQYARANELCQWAIHIGE